MPKSSKYSIIFIKTTNLFQNHWNYQVSISPTKLILYLLSSNIKQLLSGSFFTYLHFLLLISPHPFFNSQLNCVFSDLLCFLYLIKFLLILLSNILSFLYFWFFLYFKWRVRSNFLYKRFFEQNWLVSQNNHNLSLLCCF